MGDSHAWADMYTLNPHVQLSALFKRKKRVVAYAKHTVNNPRGTFLPTHMFLKGGTDFQFVVSNGGQPCMGRHVYMEPPCTVVRPIETQ